MRFFRNSRLSFWQTYSKPTSSNALTSSGFSSTLTVNSSSPLVTTAKAGNSYQVMSASECFSGYHPPLLFFRASYVRLRARSCGKQAFRSFGINDQASEFLVRHRYNPFLNQEINCPCIGYMDVPANKLAQAITSKPACT